MGVVSQWNTGVIVNVQRTIEVGRQYRISPSYGYAGVTAGVVKVVSLVSPDRLDDATHEVIELIEFYKDTQLSLHTDRHNIPEEPEYSEELRRLDNTVWVVYEYPYESGGETDGILAFPLEEFVDHTSTL